MSPPAQIHPEEIETPHSLSSLSAKEQDRKQRYNSLTCEALASTADPPPGEGTTNPNTHLVFKEATFQIRSSHNKAEYIMSS